MRDFRNSGVASLGIGLALLALTAGARTARAELLVATTRENRLISFDSATPGTVNTIGFITGLTPGDEIAGIDRRPSVGLNNGVIYALGFPGGGGSARLYTLNETTAAVTLVATLSADPTDTTPPFPYTAVVSAGGVGMDFDPVTGFLRVITDADQNLVINPDSGLVRVETPVAYQAGDSGAGTDAIILGLAYTNNFGGAASTTLRGLDVNKGPDRRVTLSNPDNGLLQSSLNLPFDAPNIDTAYDISGVTGFGYFTASFGVSELYRDGPGGVTFVGAVNSPFHIRGLAAPVGTPVGGQVAAPEPGAFTLIVGGLLACLGARRRRNP